MRQNCRGYPAEMVCQLGGQGTLTSRSLSGASESPGLLMRPRRGLSQAEWLVRGFYPAYGWPGPSDEGSGGLIVGDDVSMGWTSVS
jgi:hypothetical protein